MWKSSRVHSWTLTFLTAYEWFIIGSKYLIPFLFADDTDFCVTGYNLNDSVSEIDDIYVWIKANKLSLNIDTSKKVANGVGIYPKTRDFLPGNIADTVLYIFLSILELLYAYGRG